MGVYIGSKYIAAQLDSLAAQTHDNWRLIVSDDGSSEATLQIVKNYQSKWGGDKVQIRKGAQSGFAQNFLSVACAPSIKSGYL